MLCVVKEKLFALKKQTANTSWDEETCEMFYWLNKSLAELKGHEPGELTSEVLILQWPVGSWV